MGIMETIKDKVFGSGQEGQTMKMISQLITDSGGLGGLTEKFNAAGLGATMKSWLSSAGTKLPISPEQIQKVVGAPQLQSLATKFGLSTTQVSSELSASLPNLIGKLNPEGVKIPGFKQ